MAAVLASALVLVHGACAGSVVAVLGIDDRTRYHKKVLVLAGGGDVAGVLCAAGEVVA